MKKCICGTQMTCHEYKNQWVCHRCGRTRPIFDYSKWVIEENSCVIKCPVCSYRLELCYPDGTEVRYLPHCPDCGSALERGE
jgi:hypothetical protein